MPFEDTKILEFSQYEKSDKVPSTIYANLECIIEKIDGCKIDLENSSTRNVNEHTPAGFSMYTISLLRSIEDKHDIYRGKDYIKTFC